MIPHYEEKCFMAVQIKCSMLGLQGVGVRCGHCIVDQDHPPLPYQNCIFYSNVLIYCIKYNKI